MGNELNGLFLFDIRTRKIVNRYLTTRTNSNLNNNCFKQNIMSVQFNSSGNRLGALRANLKPVLYDLNDIQPEYLFNSGEFKNSCTLKSFCFAGDQDEYFVLGSDDSSVFVWKIPSDIKEFKINDIHLKLNGHRSIVNQYNLIASSGIERVIKIWSPYKLANSEEEEELFKEEDKELIEYFDLQIKRQQTILNSSQSEDKSSFEQQSKTEDSISCSSSESTYSLSESESDDLDIDFKKAKKYSNSLRNRLRNLRHRKSLNFINVLDCLKVKNSNSNETSELDKSNNKILK